MKHPKDKRKQAEKKTSTTVLVQASDLRDAVKKLDEGMMCGHCEATVKKALEALDGVEEAVVSHEEGTAVVSMTNEVSDDVLTQTVEDKDYKVTGIE